MSALCAARPLAARYASAPPKLLPSSTGRMIKSRDSMPFAIATGLVAVTSSLVARMVVLNGNVTAGEDFTEMPGRRTIFFATTSMSPPRSSVRNSMKRLASVG